MQYQEPTTAAILGTDTVVEYILELLLRDAGYATRPLKPIPRE